MCRKRYVDGVDLKLNYSLPISEAEKPHTYFSAIYSALNALKELVLNEKVQGPAFGWGAGFASLRDHTCCAGRLPCVYEPWEPAGYKEPLRSARPHP